MAKISVYLPTHNRPELLLRAVNSCLLQDYPDFELIIVDDASAAKYHSEINRIATLDPRIRLLRAEQPAGACVARNMAIEAASGTYITGLDDDDEFLPGRLTALYAAAQAHPKAAFICSGYQIKTRQGKLLTSNKGARQIELADLLYSNIVGNQVLTTRAAFMAVGGFDPAMTACQDYDAWIRLSAQFGTGVRIADCSYLIHLDHEHPRISADSRRQSGYRRLYEKHLHLMDRQQQRSQQLFQLLYTTEPTLKQLVTTAPWRKLPVALKVYLLRKIGYDI